MPLNSCTRIHLTADLQILFSAHRITKMFFTYSSFRARPVFIAIIPCLRREMMKITDKGPNPIAPPQKATKTTRLDTHRRRRISIDAANQSACLVKAGS